MQIAVQGAKNLNLAYIRKIYLCVNICCHYVITIKKILYAIYYVRTLIIRLTLIHAISSVLDFSINHVFNALSMHFIKGGTAPHAQDLSFFACVSVTVKRNIFLMGLTGR